jgi:hypothetical protein
VWHREWNRGDVKSCINKGITTASTAVYMYGPAGTGRLHD